MRSVALVFLAALFCNCVSSASNLTTGLEPYVSNAEVQVGSAYPPSMKMSLGRTVISAALLEVVEVNPKAFLPPNVTSSSSIDPSMITWSELKDEESLYDFLGDHAIDGTMHDPNAAWTVTGYEFDAYSNSIDAFGATGEAAELLLPRRNSNYSASFYWRRGHVIQNEVELTYKNDSGLPSSSISLQLGEYLFEYGLDWPSLSTNGTIAIRMEIAYEYSIPKAQDYATTLGDVNVPDEVSDVVIEDADDEFRGISLTIGDGVMRAYFPSTDCIGYANAGGPMSGSIETDNGTLLSVGLFHGAKSIGFPRGWYDFILVVGAVDTTSGRLRSMPPSMSFTSVMGGEKESADGSTTNFWYIVIAVLSSFCALLCTIPCCAMFLIGTTVFVVVQIPPQGIAAMESLGISAAWIHYIREKRRDAAELATLSPRWQKEGGISAKKLMFATEVRMCEVEAGEGSGDDFYPSSINSARHDEEETSSSPHNETPKTRMELLNQYKEKLAHTIFGTGKTASEMYFDEDDPYLESSSKDSVRAVSRQERFMSIKSHIGATIRGGRVGETKSTRDDETSSVVENAGAGRPEKLKAYKESLRGAASPFEDVEVTDPNLSRSQRLAQYKQKLKASRNTSTTPNKQIYSPKWARERGQADARKLMVSEEESQSTSSSSSEEASSSEFPPTPHDSTSPSESVAIPSELVTIPSELTTIPSELLNRRTQAGVVGDDDDDDAVLSARQERIRRAGERIIQSLCEPTTGVESSGPINDEYIAKSHNVMNEIDMLFSEFGGPKLRSTFANPADDDDAILEQIAHTDKHSSDQYTPISARLRSSVKRLTPATSNELQIALKKAVESREKAYHVRSSSASSAWE